MEKSLAWYKRQTQMNTVLHYIEIKKVFVMTKGTDFLISTMRPETRWLLKSQENSILRVYQNVKIGYHISVPIIRKYIWHNIGIQSNITSAWCFETKWYIYSIRFVKNLQKIYIWIRHSILKYQVIAEMVL